MTGNVRDYYLFITLIIGLKISSMKMLEIWIVNDKNRSELLSFLVWKVEKVVCVSNLWQLLAPPW